MDLMQIVDLGKQDANKEVSDAAFEVDEKVTFYKIQNQ